MGEYVRHSLGETTFSMRLSDTSNALHQIQNLVGNTGPPPKLSLKYIYSEQQDALLKMQRNFEIIVSEMKHIDSKLAPLRSDVFKLKDEQSELNKRMLNQTQTIKSMQATIEENEKSLQLLFEHTCEVSETQKCSVRETRKELQESLEKIKMENSVSTDSLNLQANQIQTLSKIVENLELKITSQISIPPVLLAESIKSKVNADVLPSTARKGTIKIPEYDGTWEVELFEQQVKSASKLNGWDEEELSAHLLNAVRGQARDALTCIPSTSVFTSEKILEIMKARFGLHMQQDLAKTQLQEKRQLRGESLRQLALNIEKLMHRAYPSAEQATKDSLATDAFLTAIWDTEVRLQVRLRSPVTLKRAVEEAESVEACLRQARGTRRSTLSAALDTTDEANTNLKLQLKELTKKVEKLQQPYTNDFKLNQKAPGELGVIPTQQNNTQCYSCRQLGHIARDCPSRTPNPQRQQMYRPSEGQGKDKPLGSERHAQRN
jgi:hypothetical protein